MTSLEHTTGFTSSTPVPSNLVYEGQIVRDRGEMLSLTDMWRAAGSPANREPFNWERKEGAGFIEAVTLSHNLPASQVMEKRQGKGGGTFAHWQIALAYAKYLSPEFHMWCNTVVRGRMQALNEPRGYVVLPVAQVAGASEIVFNSYFGIAQTIGLDRNQSALAANRATRSLTGQDPLSLLGHAQLEAPRPERHLTPTDIGKQVGGKSARAVNAILEQIGLQRSGRDAKGNQYWEPTAEGQAFGVMLDTGKKHSDGAPVCQLKWRSGVVSQVEAALDDPA